MLRSITAALILIVSSISSVQAQATLAAMEELEQNARASVPVTTLSDIGAALRPHDIIYMPEGKGPFAAVLFFHGCSGRTLSHEQDWARRFNKEGIAVITVDSYSGRGINWEDACNMQEMLPWQRAGDILSTIEYAKTLDKINGDELYVAGFSHGAITIWSTLVYASSETAPVGLASWPKGGIDGLKGAFMFYGSCLHPWTVDVDATMFLGEADIYIDEEVCEAYLPNHPEGAGPLMIEIYKNATHTFDHAKPNASNVEAGSVYDATATEASWERIKQVIKND